MEDSIHAVLSGNFDLQSLPDVPSKVVKLYVCSTPTDTIQERQALMQRVYLPLREYCRQKYGLEFHMVDLRWGIDKGKHEVWGDRHLRLKEIEECQRLSVGPNFVALIGQKYGERPIPESIPASDFELVRTALRNHRNRETRDVALLDQWYKKDYNAVPAVYVLQLPDALLSQPGSDAWKQCQDKWEQTQESLSRLLQKGVDYCTLEGTMLESDRQQYVISDLEREIQQGILHADDPQNMCHVYQRTIVDLKNYVNTTQASDFMEVIYNEREEKHGIDEDTQSCLRKLTHEYLPKWLPKNNIHQFAVLWKFEGGIHPDLHKNYLNEFCETFHENIRDLIDRLAHGQVHASLPPVVDEVFQHWIMCKMRCENFQGRKDVIDIIKAYVISNSNRALVLSGECGCGKTSVMAKAISEVNGWLDGNMITVMRFLGITASSFDIRQIIHSLCIQIAHVLGREESIVPNEYKDLLNYFNDTLSTFPDDKNLVIFLDSLDMLDASYSAHQLEWLPTCLKENVKIIVSTLPEAHGLLQRLQEDRVQDVDNFVDIPHLSAEECLDMLMTYLQHSQRDISDEQKTAAIAAFEKCSLPLFVKLMLEEAKSWTTFSAVNPEQLPANTKEFIHTIFDHLEAKYGKVFVSGVIAYLTASATGLSDCEMEDLLSLDNEIMAAVSMECKGIPSRIPTLLWVRLRDALSPFLTRKECEGMAVYYWYHRQFVEVSRHRYLTDSSYKKRIHVHLADYFLGTWNGKPKPLDDSAMTRMQGNNVKCSDRLVPSQPMAFRSENGTVRYNKRKYDQVPRHLLLSGRLVELNQMVMFNYEWLYNKSKSLSLEHVLADFMLNPGVEASLVERALRDSQHIIASDINMMAPELSGRLLSYYATHPNIRELIKQCDKAGLAHCALVPQFPYHDIPGSPLKHTLHCSDIPNSFAFTGDSRCLLTKERKSSTIRSFDLVTGEMHKELYTSGGDMFVSPKGAYIVLLDHITGKVAKVHHASSGEFCGHLIPTNHLDITQKDKFRITKVCVSDAFVCLVVTGDKNYLCIADIETCQFIQMLELEGKAEICNITADSRIVFCNAGMSIMSYDLVTSELVCNLPTDYVPVDIIFTLSGKRAFLRTDNKQKLSFLHLREGSIEFSYKVNLEDELEQDHIEEISLSHHQNTLLVRGHSHLVLYDIHEEITTTVFQRPGDVPMEFKLPRSRYYDIGFTQAIFSPDDKFLVATIFRKIYVWQISNANLLTTLQAPVGIIKTMRMSSYQSLIITHMEQARSIHVWNLGDAIGHVTSLDKLTAPVEEILFSANSKTAFVRCEKSDELGIFDMATGKLIDLLTHDSSVTKMAITPDGHYAFIITEPTSKNRVNKIWNIKERRVISEFGHTCGYVLPFMNASSIYHITQEDESFKSPYSITLFTFFEDHFEEIKLPHVINYIISEPFISDKDRYLVIHAAEDYAETRALYMETSICAVPVATPETLKKYKTVDIHPHIKVSRILHTRAVPNNPYTVVVLYTNERDPVNRPPTAESRLGYEHCYGFLIFDVCSGVVCQVIETLLSPSTPIEHALFTQNISVCIDDRSNLFDMASGHYIKQLSPRSSRPRKFALNGRAVIYLDGCYISVLRISDGTEIAKCDAHCRISSIEVGRDDRTVVIGCEDGTVLSYVLVDVSQTDNSMIVEAIASRQHPLTAPLEQNQALRSWDKVGEAISSPPYSRPPSALSSGPSDRQLLKNVKPAPRMQFSASHSQGSANVSSKVCAIM